MSLGGSNTTSVKLPGFIEDAAKRAIGLGERAGQIGFVPFSGPDVAAFTPQQEAAFAGTNQAASAFGLPTAQGTGLPEPQTFAGGVQGFSSLPLFEQALAELQRTRPGQFDAINEFFIDPFTGAAATGADTPLSAQTGGGGFDPRGLDRDIPIGADRNPAQGGLLGPGGFSESGAFDRFFGGGSGIGRLF